MFWVLAVYLPGLITISIGALYTLAVGHMIVYPEKAVEAFWNMMGCMPCYLAYAWDRMSTAAFNKVFDSGSGTTGAQPSGLPPGAQSELAPPPPSYTNAEQEGQRLLIFMGWVGHCRPARPPARPRG